jgi:hypothetical protein
MSIIRIPAVTRKRAAFRRVLARQVGRGSTTVLDDQGCNCISFAFGLSADSSPSCPLSFRRTMKRKPFRCSATGLPVYWKEQKSGRRIFLGITLQVAPQALWQRFDWSKEVGLATVL